jgi:hypothetical protein
VSLTDRGALIRRKIIRSRQRQIAAALNSGLDLPDQLVPGLRHIVQALATHD